MYPTSSFTGKVVGITDSEKAKVEGVLNIHGVTKNIVVEGNEGE